MGFRGSGHQAFQLLASHLTGDEAQRFTDQAHESHSQSHPASTRRPIDDR
jgi:hypothetical protein